MAASAPTTEAMTKGERTAARILDAAESIFAARGFEATSLREIARAAGIQQPGLYNHFRSKQALYAAVLDRALSPMLEAMQEASLRTTTHGEPAGLPSAITDILIEHPKLAALFQQALQGDSGSTGNRLTKRWLDRLFGQAVDTTRATGLRVSDAEDMAIRIIAMFNIATGYFLSQRAFASMARGDITDPKNLARQKRLLERVARAALAA